MGIATSPPVSSSQSPPGSLQQLSYQNQNIAVSLGNFPKFWPKNSELFVLTKIWHTWYLAGADFDSGLRSLKSRPQN